MSATNTHDTHAAGHADHDASAPKIYGAVLLALLVLTGITVSASYIQFGSGIINVVVALTIATIKASLVALFFMHLLHDKPMNAIILLSSFVFLGIFLGYCYTDQSTRDLIQPANLKVQAAAPSSAPANAAPPAHEPAEHH
jgi:cytochrome c oxidase subunit 4